MNSSIWATFVSREGDELFALFCIEQRNDIPIVFALEQLQRGMREVGRFKNQNGMSLLMVGTSSLFCTAQFKTRGTQPEKAVETAEEGKDDKADDDGSESGDDMGFGLFDDDD